MQPLRRALAHAAAVTIGGLAVMSAIRVTLPATGPLSLSVRGDCAGYRDGRLAGARRALPKTGVVGYVGPRDTSDGCDGLMTTAYALAPLVVFPIEDDILVERVRRDDLITSSHPELVVLDATHAPSAEWFRTQTEYRVLQDAGQGITILAKRP